MAVSPPSQVPATTFVRQRPRINEVTRGRRETKNQPVHAGGTGFEKCSATLSIEIGARKWTRILELFPIFSQMHSSI
jgi:hypothetical protein